MKLSNSIGRLGALICLSALLSGCDASKPANEFEPNYLFAHALEVETGSPMNQAVAETQAALQVLFGTPDQPKLPAILSDKAEFANLVRLDRIQSAGPSGAGGGLYARHCATCHGTVGNGRGLTAALLEPYPRDYRTGKYKFKSTPGVPSRLVKIYSPRSVTASAARR